MPAKMPVKWEDLTATDFPKAVAKSKRVCIVPIGVIEKHGPHLPLGTDVMAARAVAVGAAEREYAVVFPWYYFGQIYEARHQPGCIAVSPDLMTPLLTGMCGEIARNGFEKIVILNGHGGNNAWLDYFCQLQLAEDRGYTVYVPPLGAMDPKIAKEIAARRKTDFGGHADEVESSWMMAIRPDLVKPEYIKLESGRARRRLKDLGSVHTGIWWYADFPLHYAGDASSANAELGELALEGKVKAIVAALRAVKKDTAAPRLQREFHTKAETGGMSPPRRRRS